MTTDIERELRELFRDKAEQAPLDVPITPASAPQGVLRRGRLHQMATVFGTAAIVLVLIVGSVAGMNALLRGDDQFGTGEKYDVFTRTTAIEAFTITSPSDWYLVNQWPLSMQIPVTAAGASEACSIDPEGNEVCEPGTGTTEQLEPPPYGLPMFQLSNADLGLSTIACGQDLAADAAVLYVALDYERAIFGAQPAGAVGPPVTPPVELSPDAESAACGQGMYAAFSVAGEPFFAWIGLGENVSDPDRATVMAAYASMAVDDAWAPIPPDEATPGYVIAGGTATSDGPWRLELRPGEEVELALYVQGTSGRLDVSLGSEPVTWCCASMTEPDRAGDGVIFGAVQESATGVVFQPDDERGDIRGTILPLPPTLGSLGVDLFFIEGADGLVGDVVALGLETGRTTSPAPVAEPRDEEVELSGKLFGQAWTARFGGTFSDETACIDVTIAGEIHEPLCQERRDDSLVADRSSMHGWLTPDLHLLAGTVPPEVAEIRFASDDDAIFPTQFRCAVGPLGWTDPDRKVCAIALPPTGSGTLEYVDAAGTVLFEEGIGWGVAEPG